MGYGTQGPKESDMTERLHFHFQYKCLSCGLFLYRKLHIRRLFSWAGCGSERNKTLKVIRTSLYK